MDTKSNQISYQVAWKGAIELISQGVKRVELTTDDIGAEVAELADMLFSQLAVRLNNFQGGGTVTPITAAPSYPTPETTPPFEVAPAAPVAAAPAGPTGPAGFVPSPVEPPWLLTSTPCPDCQQKGRTGVLIQHTDVNSSYGGPEFKCVLKQSTKQGSAWVETGLCEYQDWGRNSRR